MKLLVLASLVAIFVLGGIGIFVTLSDTIGFQKLDLINDYYEKDEKYDVLLWKSYTYDQYDQKLVTIHRNENYDITYWKEFKYDQWGNLLESIQYDNKGNLKKIQKSIFDSSGNRIKTTAFDEQDNLARIQESVFIPNFKPKVSSQMSGELTLSSVDISYDENRNQIKIQYVSKNGTKMLNHSYIYDSFDNMIEKKVVTHLGNIMEFEQREYDDVGNLITLKVMPPRFDYEFITNYEYDKKGNKIVETLRIPKDNNEYIKTNTYTSYDDKGNKIVEKTVNTLDKLISFNTIIYDNAGNIIESREFGIHTNINSWKKFNYDQRDNLIESKEFDRDANIISWKKFNYDQRDNLIESKEFSIEKIFVVEKKSHKNNDFELSSENNDDFQKFSNSTLIDSNEIIITPSFADSNSNLLSPSSCVLDCFIPNPVKVDIRTQVTFYNTAISAHTFTSGNPYDGPSRFWDSGLLVSGMKYSVILNEEGTYEYYSIVAPWMSGKIVVGDIAGHQPPTANAGSDQIVYEGTTVCLSGTGTDPEKQLMTYIWTQLSNHPSVHLSDTNIPGQSSTVQNPTFLAPDVDEDTDFIFRLIVTDTIPPSAPKSLPELDVDTVTITIQNIEDNTISDGINMPDCHVLESMSEQYTNSTKKKYTIEEAIELQRKRIEQNRP